ncbi:urea carboxylase [Nocardia flavorosea]|uniref:urea carboxylase n=1 Tax=Nocardia flavorosea TaxID=53429 RepID=UPI002B4ACDD1|nr:urea carboxylase [Nocardia flavorosea]
MTETAPQLYTPLHTPLPECLLIANRGEIACRILRTARRLGIDTVAVFSDADEGSRHVRMADRAVRLGPAPAAESYLRAEAVIEAALSSGATAIHPGYGFLSENADFAAEVEAAGIAFVGPAAEHLRLFGDKHSARQAAAAAGVPLVAGSGLLAGLDEALAEADRIGYPVMLKAAGGGGGIGMAACAGPAELTYTYQRVIRLAQNNFGSSSVYLERFVARARHVEVQIFGDGRGRAISLGTRDCSLQRRNQKVIEEAPAPGLPYTVSERLLESSRKLLGEVGYRSAGTVEFIYDVDRGEASFLEVNTRLQVEHPVTEAVTGVDLVEWMLRLAGGDSTFLDNVPDAGPPVTGFAVEARVYAEDPGNDYRPGAGTLTGVEIPGAEARVETWVETGTEISPYYDPLIAKIITSGESRTEALHRLRTALDNTRMFGITTNLPQLRAAATSSPMLDARHTTATLGSLATIRPRLEILRAGVSTTVQDYPGRLGLWNVGIPPSGAFDDLSFQLANHAVGNSLGENGLEATLLGPRLRCTDTTIVCVTGAEAPVTVDGAPVPMWEPITVPAGSVVDIGAPYDTGLRTYLAVRGGILAPDYHGSAATFTLGGFGGITGRAVATGDILGIKPDAGGLLDPAPIPAEERPEFGHTWYVGVGEGPQPAPDYFTPADIAQFYDATWQVQAHANRTGLRLAGPKPTWSRTDGGDAGLHPSNLHDCPYSVGALNLSGDTPILLGPDGPSLGGFACPLTVVSAHRWKLGQMRPGDQVRFVPVADDRTAEFRAAPALRGRNISTPELLGSREEDNGVLGRRDAGAGTPEVKYLRGGDDNVLVEYGPMELDLGLRMRVHALGKRLDKAAIPGLIDITPGVRSLHLHFDADVIDQRTVVRLLGELEDDIPDTADLRVPSRHIELPLSFDDPAIAQAIERYRHGVRSEAPWLPSNIEFIRRINGLDSVEEVRDIVFDAQYMVLGLGDVYLGAPLAVPLDPRHRLVTTKYNPARTWTPSDAVGIGGKYLCVYGMESPGGYQLIGRTVPIWSGYRQRAPFETGKPWLFRFFDRISWYPVSAEELLDLRADMSAGRFEIRTSVGEFAMAEHLGFLAEHATDIAGTEEIRQIAFTAERQRWEAGGELSAQAEPDPAPETADTLDLPEGCEVVSAPMMANVWRVEVAEGDRVEAGATLLVLEAMKMELPVAAEAAGTVRALIATAGDQVTTGAPLVVIETEGAA